MSEWSGVEWSGVSNRVNYKGDLPMSLLLHNASISQLTNSVPLSDCKTSKTPWVSIILEIKLATRVACFDGSGDVQAYLEKMSITTMTY